ncbi:MAG: DEAD/DEAH box helicase [Cyanobacteria bacterium P01_D01_bin.56]
MSVDVESAPSFSQLSLSEAVLEALEDLGYESPTPIQAQTIPHVLAGVDIIGQAQTGTGKTAAFALPLLSRVDISQRLPHTLVLTPTRELAIQVAEAFQSYASHMKGFHVLPLYGGQSYSIQLRKLERSVHIVVGTPGRVMDHMKRGTLDLSQLQCLVLDEADEMLRMGFIDDVEWVLEKTPDSRQVALFSATLPREIRHIAQRHLDNPTEVLIKSKTSTADTIRQRYWMVSGYHKLDALTRILETESFDGMIVFVRTRLATVELAEKLEARGYETAPLSGDVSQIQRERTVEQLKSGKLDIVVATDVAARGLDVERISHVINYDMPYDTETYVHRVGRTGRAGRKGEAILFVSPRERRLLNAIERATKQKIAKMEMPSTEMVNDRRIARFKQQITDTLAEENLEFFTNLMEQYEQEHNVPAIEIASALAKLVQGDEPLLLVERKRSHPERGDRRDRRDRRDRKAAPPEKGMGRYRIEVGHRHRVKPGHIVGAIANESGLESRYIGRINIYDSHSTVDLPEGMPKEILRHLKKVSIAGKPLRISKVEGELTGKDSGKRRPKPKTKKH